MKLYRRIRTAQRRRQILRRCYHIYCDGLHHADDLTLQHEAERAETLPPSPLVKRMRRAVDTEQKARRTVTAGIGGGR